VLKRRFREYNRMTARWGNERNHFLLFVGHPGIQRKLGMLEEGSEKVSSETPGNFGVCVSKNFVLPLLCRSTPTFS